MRVAFSVSGAELRGLLEESKDEGGWQKMSASVPQTSTSQESESPRRSGDAVAARNGLWVTLRYRPYCAAAVRPERTAALRGQQEGTTCLSLLHLLHRCMEALVGHCAVAARKYWSEGSL